jgi:hypothetical protein
MKFQAWFKEVCALLTQSNYPIPPTMSRKFSNLGYYKGSFPVKVRIADLVPIMPFLLRL